MIWSNGILKTIPANMSLFLHVIKLYTFEEKDHFNP